MLPSGFVQLVWLAGLTSVWSEPLLGVGGTGELFTEGEDGGRETLFDGVNV